MVRLGRALPMPQSGFAGSVVVPLGSKTGAPLRRCVGGVWMPMRAALGGSAVAGQLTDTGRRPIGVPPVSAGIPPACWAVGSTPPGAPPEHALKNTSGTSNAASAAVRKR